jgi:hypothetical protein
MLFFAGCDHEVAKDLPNIKPVSELPVFTEQTNEIEIADKKIQIRPSDVRRQFKLRTSQ